MSIFSQNESQHLTLTAPSAVDLTTGSFTVAMLARNIAFQRMYCWRAIGADNFSHLDLFFDGDVWVNFIQWDGNLDTSSPIWRWIVISKGPSTEAPRVHIAEYTSSGSMSWIHEDMPGTQGNWPPTDRISIGDEFGSGFQGDLACLSAFTSNLDDTQVESLFSRNSATIMNAGPQFFVHFPQVDGVSSPFVDLAGGGVETIRTGTWTSSSDPTGFDFSLGRSGKPKVWDGTDWTQRQAKVWDGSEWIPSQMSGYNGSEFMIAK